MQLLKWSFQLPGTTSTCANLPPNLEPDGSLVPVTFLEEYRYCMKSKLPDTEIVIFNKNNDYILDWANMGDNYQPYKENAPKEIVTYHSACSGDSGSGQFVANDIDPLKIKESLDELRYVLVAIFSGKFQKTFMHNGELYNFPCGSYTWDNGEYKYSSAESESTTWPENLRWIKKKANICKGSSCNIS